VRLHKGGARRGTRDIGVAGRKVCEPVEAINEAQHVRHQDVGDGERGREPFAFRQQRLRTVTAIASS
jgi:hypothetical protein